MQQVVPDIFRFGSRYHNFYLLVEGGKATVLDAGCSKEMPALIAGLSAVGLELADVEAILLTHAHADHIGFAAEASRQGTKVKAHEIEAPMARGDEKIYAIKPNKMPLWKPGIWPFVFALMKAGVTKVPMVPGVETFGDGEQLDLPGRPKAIHTPGHTRGHAVFYLAEREILFTGDALVTMNVTGGRRGPQLLPKNFNRDEAQARQSLQLLVPLTTQLVVPGHGDPWQGSVAEAVALVG